MTNNQAKTTGQIEYDRLKKNAAANKRNGHTYFNSVALTVTGELCVGMTRSKTNFYYSCTYTGKASERNFGDSRRWNLQGRSLDGLSDLDMTTLQAGIRTN